MCSQIISPGQDFLQNEYPNGGTQGSDAMAARALRREKAGLCGTISAPLRAAMAGRPMEAAQSSQLTSFDLIRI
jgi:hypothetical protein